MKLVRCIKPDEDKILKLSHIYRVEEHQYSEDDYLVIIPGDSSKTGFLKSRFVDVKTYKVRAIESTTGGPVSGLVQGQLYEVTELPGDSGCWCVEPYSPKDGYYKSRFSDPIDDRVPMGSRPLHLVDREEERLRAILTTRSYPNECPCGTNRSACRYHK